MPRTTTAVFACLFLAMLAADAAAQQPAAASGVPNASGFLKDYSRLQPVPGKDGRYAWTAPSAELKPYTQFILPPMESSVSPASIKRASRRCWRPTTPS